MAANTVLYGIPNCDTVKKAHRWLDAHGIDYRFHDFRKDGLDATRVKRWLAAVGEDKLINRRSTTWRQLPAAVREGLDKTSAAPLLLEHPTLIKRPVLEHADAIHVGFSPQDYARLF